MSTSTYKPTANPELAKAMLEKRMSSATEPHKDKRTKRARTRRAAKQKAIKDHA